jgi:CBS domain-containing protein
MTQQPVVAAETESLEKALETMRRIGVRRLPVVGSRGQLVGVLSLDDIIDALALDLGDVAASIRKAQRVESALRP